MGKVVLIGAGPGDSELLTLKAKEALENADVVLFDRLVGMGIVAQIPRDAIKIDVGKKAHDHKVPQDEINSLILGYAKNGKTVVRLKGGDPYLFGRGAEELEEIVDQGIDFEVIPGITSALSVPAYAGIPVTHRDFSSSVHIITGHGRDHTDPDIAYKNLVGFGGTLVFLMGVGELETITENLIKAGMRADMPVALIHRGSTHRQKTLLSDLENIYKEATEQDFAPPSVLVVGEVCTLSEKLNWFERKPLHSASVLVTQPRGAKSRLAKKLKEQGATVVELPAIETRPLEMQKELADKLHTYSWVVFTSRFAVDIFLEGLTKNGIDIRSLGNLKFAVVGAATKRALEKRGILVDYMPEVYIAEHLAEGLAPKVQKEDKILLYRSAIGRNYLAEKLSEAGAVVDDVAAYETDIESGQNEYIKEKLLNGDIQYVALTSASSVEGFTNIVGDIDYSKVKSICIGEQTAKAAREHKLDVTLSPKASLDSMVETIIKKVEGKKDEE